MKNFILFLLSSVILSNNYTQNPNKAFDNILSSYVDSFGNVNYQGIIDNPFSFDEYFDFIEYISPINHPEYFNTWFLIFSFI